MNEIYETASNVRSIIDNLKKIVHNEISLNGISNAQKLKVLLLGETSSGKTSFLKRIFGESCGEVGPTPITAFAVVHRTAKVNKSSLHIKFKQSFSIIKKKNEFIKFLQKWELDDIQSTNNDFSSKSNEYSALDNYSNDRFEEFIKTANEFPEAIDEIIWEHRERENSSKQSKFLKFADLYDMPGTGGQESHNINYDNLMNKYKDSDIVLYLLKSDQGVPSSYDFIKQLTKQIKQNTQIYFIYQIDNKDNFGDKVKSLNDFFNKDKDSDAINPLSPNEKLFYKDTFVVDARGDTNDLIHADTALSIILKQTIIQRLLDFQEKLQFNTEIPYGFSMLAPSKISKDGINERINTFFKNVYKKCEGREVKVSETEENFKKEFCLDKDISIGPSDQGEFIKYLRHEIIATLEKLCDELSDLSFPPFHKDRKMNPTKLNNIQNIYKKDSNYPKLVYWIQCYHFIQLSYSTNIENSYISEYIKGDSNLLSEIITKLKNIEDDETIIQKLNINVDYSSIENQSSISKNETQQNIIGGTITTENDTYKRQTTKKTSTKKKKEENTNSKIESKESCDTHCGKKTKYELGMEMKSKGHLKNAFDYFMQSAKDGDTNGQFQLAECYYFGYGVDKDLRRAYSWYNFSCRSGNKEAKKCLQTYKFIQ